MIHETKCLICGKPQTASYPNVICNDCRNPDTSTLEDFVAKLLRLGNALAKELQSYRALRDEALEVHRVESITLPAAEIFQAEAEEALEEWNGAFNHG